MDSNHRIYNYVSSFNRIDEILSQPQGNYEERTTLPDRDELTYTNGFYAYCSALFVDIRDSSKLPSIYRRPALAKLYRAFISEVVAILNSHQKAREVNIVGDCVWGVFNTPQKADIDELFTTACRVNSLMKVLNYKLLKNNYKTPIQVGIGISYGRALMIKAGYSGSGLADVVYMGDVVNKASKLAAIGGGTKVYHPMVLDGIFRQNLNEHNTGLTSYVPEIDAYVSTAVNTVMEEWYRQSC